MAAFPAVPRPIQPIATTVALLAVAVPAPALGQTGGTSVPGPGDPCPATYPGDDAGREPIARWMARAAALQDVPEELPVIAGLAESGLRNLRRRGNPYAGFFSMHRSLDRGAYRGFRRKPRLQLDWFLDSAVLARQRELAEGDEGYGSDPSGYGHWVADVERPVRANRSGYQRYLEEADGLLSESCRPADHAADAQPPALRVRAARRQRDAISVSASCPAEPCMVAASATPARRARRASAVAAGATPVTLTLAGRAWRSARLTVTVTAVDEAGNATRTDRSVLLLR